MSKERKRMYVIMFWIWVFLMLEHWVLPNFPKYRRIKYHFNCLVNEIFGEPKGEWYYEE